MGKFVALDFLEGESAVAQLLRKKFDERVGGKMSHFADAQNQIIPTDQGDCMYLYMDGFDVRSPRI